MLRIDVWTSTCLTLLAAAALPLAAAELLKREVASRHNNEIVARDTVTTAIYSYYTESEVFSVFDASGSAIAVTATGDGVVSAAVTDVAGDTIPVLYAVTTGEAPTGAYTTVLSSAVLEATAVSSALQANQTGLSSGSNSTTAVTITNPNYPDYCLAVYTLLEDADGNVYNKLNNSTPVKLSPCDTKNRGQYWLIDNTLASGTPGYTTNIALDPFDSNVNYCVDATQSDPDNSTPLQVWQCACQTAEWSGTSGQACADPLPAQQWTFEAVTYQGAAAYNILVNVGETEVTADRPHGVCIDVSNSNTDQALQSWSCNAPEWPNGNQVFIFSTDTPYDGA